MNPHSSPGTSDGNSQSRIADKRRIRWLLVMALLGLLGGCAIGFALYVRPSNNQPFAKQSGAAEGKQANGVSVDVIQPQPGGIDRVSVQPGTVEPFESADLYAKVSGFLVQTLDIGAPVRRGQVLARLSVPEYERQVEKDVAGVEHSIAKVKQMEAHLTAARAEARAARQMIQQAKIDLKTRSAYRSFRSKQRDRITALYKDNAIEATLVDEQMDRFEAAIEAENAAKEAITTAELKAEAAKAKVAQAEADIDDAKAEVKVARAELAKSKVLLDYTVITSPYDGVVTKRSFSRGDFIRSADAGGDRVPVVAVDRTDLMRIIVQVPDRDVPYVDISDAATIQIDALPGRTFTAVIARAADAEDQQTRTMRTEIDMPNHDGKLRRNMYGRVMLTLQKGAPSAVRVPSSALVGKSDGDQATVRVVRDHRMHLAPVEIGSDDGVQVEILKGLSETDRVILRASGPIAEGTEVTETDGCNGAASH